MSSKGALSNRLAAVNPPIAAMVGTTKTYVDTYDIPGIMGARDQGLLAWSYDPSMSLSNNTAAWTASVLYLVRMYVPAGGTATGLGSGIFTAGVSVSGNAGMALYSDAGTRLAMSANIAANFTSTGYQQFAFTAPVDLTAGTYYWGSVLVQTASTAPIPVNTAMLSAVYDGVNGVARSISYSATTSFPASVTIASGTNAFTSWMTIY